MKFRKTIEMKIPAKYLQMDVPILHEEDMPEGYPFMFGNTWRPIIDIETGQICHFPAKSEPQNLYIKVSDNGRYTLHDKNFTCLHRYEGYVPNKFIPGEFGDYIALKIDEYGNITNWPKEICLDELFGEGNVFERRMIDLVG